MADDQAETDRYWAAIVGNGGQESACGWCKDKWGLSWQITPVALTKAVTDPDPAVAKRAFDAMMQMKKIDIAAIGLRHDSTPGVQGHFSPAARRLDRGDVDLLHRHHRLKRSLRLSATGGQRIGQHARRDLPRDAPSVLAPAARALLAAIADDGVPIAIGLFLIVGGDLEREGFVVLERGTAVDA